MIENNLKELVKISLISAINDLQNSKLIDVNINDTVEKFQLFDDSLSIVIFFTSLESSLSVKLNKEVQLDIEKLVSQDLEHIETFNDLINLIHSTIK